MAETMWLVRAEEGGYLIDEFVTGGFITIGWYELGDLREVTSQEEISELYNRAYPDDSPVEYGMPSHDLPIGAVFPHHKTVWHYLID